MKPRQINPWSIIALLAGVAAGGGAGALLGWLAAQRDQLRRSLPDRTDDLPGILDFEEDLTDEPEPDDVQYAEDVGPCAAPPAPWDVPVAMTLEGSDVFCVPPADLEPLRRTDVPFAVGGFRPRWPLDTNSERKLAVSYQDVRKLWHGRWGRHFGASRSSCPCPVKGKPCGCETIKRVHVGVDLFADPGDVVVAMEDGQILATLPFYKGTGAIYQLTDSGLIINYGEIDMGSWRDFGLASGVDTGERVKAGQPIAKVGVSSDGSHMLHVETYTASTNLDDIRRGDMQWKATDEPPANILDPTRYLVRAQRVKAEEIA